MKDMQYFTYVNCMRYIQYTTIVSTGYNLYPYLNININNANASTVPEAAVSQIYPVFIIECQTMVVAKARKQGCSYDREVFKNDKPCSFYHRKPHSKTYPNTNPNP